MNQEEAAMWDDPEGNHWHITSGVDVYSVRTVAGGRGMGLTREDALQAARQDERANNRPRCGSQVNYEMIDKLQEAIKDAVEAAGFTRPTTLALVNGYNWDDLVEHYDPTFGIIHTREPRTEPPYYIDVEVENYSRHPVWGVRAMLYQPNPARLPETRYDAFEK